MRKTYNKPEITLVEVQASQMIAQSIETYGKDANAPGMTKERDEEFGGGMNSLW